jgi:hypothetical protein
MSPSAISTQSKQSQPLSTHARTKFVIQNVRVSLFLYLGSVSSQMLKIFWDRRSPFIFENAHSVKLRDKSISDNYDKKEFVTPQSKKHWSLKHTLMIRTEISGECIHSYCHSPIQTHEVEMQRTSISAYEPRMADTRRPDWPVATSHHTLHSAPQQPSYYSSLAGNKSCWKIYFHYERINSPNWRFRLSKDRFSQVPANTERTFICY